MSVPSESKKDAPAGNFLARYREWLPGVLIGVCLLVVGEGAGHAIRNGGYFLGTYEFLSLIRFASITGAIAIGAISCTRMAFPKAALALLKRVLGALFVAGIGLKIGAGYFHMCNAGSRWVELLAFLGTPAVAGTLAFSVKRRFLAYGLAAIVILLVWLLRDPYHDYAHTYWPEIMTP